MAQFNPMVLGISEVLPKNARKNDKPWWHVCAGVLPDTELGDLYAIRFNLQWRQPAEIGRRTVYANARSIDVC
jgi:hypothetical protein